MSSGWREYQPHDGTQRRSGLGGTFGSDRWRDKAENGSTLAIDVEDPDLIAAARRAMEPVLTGKAFSAAEDSVSKLFRHGLPPLVRVGEGPR